MADLANYGSYERDIEQAFFTLKRGTQLVKYCRQGKPKFCTFRLSLDETTLIWISHGKEKTLKLSSVLRIVSGQRTSVFKRYLRPEKDCLSFSLIYKNGERSLDLICKDKDETEVWLTSLKALISTGQRSKQPTRSDFIDDNVDFLLNDRSFGGSVEFSSSTAQGRLSLDSVSRESSVYIGRPLDVGSEYANMPIRTSVDGSRVSVSSIGQTSVASGPDDIESLGDVFIWGEVWADSASSDGSGSHVPSKIDVLTPKPLETSVVLDVYQIGPGVSHIALVTRQGEVFTWGEDSGGTLGHGFDKDFGQPHLVESLALTNVGHVACGEYHTCAVSSSGDLFTWGDGTHNAGLLGHGTDVSHWIPKRVSGPLEGLQVVSISCGTWHSAFATYNGKLYTFGDGIFGVLGHGDRESVAYPKEVQLSSGHRAIKVACGVWHTAAIIELIDQSGSPSRKLFTWGDGDQYRLGHVNKETCLQPTCVAALAEYSFQQIACGHTMTVALTASGHVFTMGGTTYGQLGNPMSDGKVPNLVRDKLVGEFVEEISCGAHHVAVLTSRSELYTWGRGANGRLGHGDTDDQKSPALVEALKERHVKNISCGSCFTTCICIHKWISGADQSVCSDCRQPFGFTRKRHNCYHCGLVYCHPCSSKKALRATLAPTPSKPHRVCDSCYVKLKGSESAIATNYNREVTRPSSSTHGREKFERGEVRPSRILLSPVTGTVKYLEIRSSKHGSGHDSPSIFRAAQVPFRLPLKDVIFPGSSSSMQYASKPSTQPSQHPAPPPPAASRPSSPYARRPPSPPRSFSPGFSRSLIDNFKKKNDHLNQEVSKLQNQINSLKKKSVMQDSKIQELQKNIEEATSLAGEESHKHCEAKEFIKSFTDQLRDVVAKFPPEIPESETLRTVHAQAEDFLNGKVEFESCTNSFETEKQSAPDIPASDNECSNLQEQRVEGNDEASRAVPSIDGGNVEASRVVSSIDGGNVEASRVVPSIDGGNVLQESNSFGSAMGVTPPSAEISARSADSYNKSMREGERETAVIEQFERGVYLTLIVIPGGAKVFKRVRFSKRRFSEQQAEEWWVQNKDRVLSKYNPAALRSVIIGTLPQGEENVEALPSSQ